MNLLSQDDKSFSTATNFSAISRMLEILGVLSFWLALLCRTRTLALPWIESPLSNPISVNLCSKSVIDNQDLVRHSSPAKYELRRSCVKLSSKAHVKNGC